MQAAGRARRPVLIGLKEGAALLPALCVIEQIQTGGTAASGHQLS
jgi:hypothetical protein